MSRLVKSSSLPVAPTLTLQDLTTYQCRMLLVLRAEYRRLADLHFDAHLSETICQRRRARMTELVNAGLALVEYDGARIRYASSPAGEVMADLVFAQRRPKPLTPPVPALPVLQAS